MIRPFVLALALSQTAGLAQAETANSEPLQPRPVISEIVQQQTTGLRSFPGVVAPEVQSDLAFQTTGQILTRPVQIGDRVTAGAILATLDSATLEEDVAVAQAAVEGAKAAAELAEKQFARTTELARRGVSAPAALESATAQRDSAVAQIASANADLKQAQDALAHAVLTAPADGIVTAVQAEPGDVVSPTMTVVVLASDQRREALVDVPEDIAALLSPGDPFDIRSQFSTGTVASGRLKLIEPVANSETRSRRLRITLRDGAQQLRLGSLVGASVAQNAAPFVTVPTTAILATDSGPRIWRIAAERRLEQVPVQLGNTVEGRVIVTQGLEIGDEILTRGVNSVSEGQIVGARTE